MMKDSKVSRRALEFAVFLCGAVVMVYEITGSRIVSPYIGASTYVWTSLIGIILAALSLGYWLGGRIADKRPDVRVLGAAVFLAGGAISATILIKDLALGFIAGLPLSLELKAVTAALFLFAPASILLGFVAPYAVKLRTASLNESGSTAGSLYALSTLGSIAGTFAAGFFLIPYLGSLRTLYLIAAILFAIGLLLGVAGFVRIKAAALVLFAAAVAVNESSALYLQRAFGSYDIDTEYSRVRVFDSIDPATSRKITSMAIDPFYVQSAAYEDSDDLVFEYSKYYALIEDLVPHHRRILMIGGAGYSFPKYFLAHYPNSRMDVAEIDPGMTQIARTHFRLRENERLNTFHEDGRVFLNKSGSGTYDAVLMDAFGSLFSVPFQLTTIEAVREIERVLKPGGVVIFNVGSAIKGEASLFLQAELAAYREVFQTVDVFKINPNRDDADLQNLIIIARRSGGPLEKNTIANASHPALLSTIYDEDIPITVPAPTDDLAPIEFYSSKAQQLRSF